jgi:excisionase family DNA binding protein
MTAPRHAFVYKRSRPDLKNAEAGRHDRLLNIDQVRRRLNCSKSHVYNLIQMGELSAITIGATKGKRVYESEVMNYLAERQGKEI